MGKEDSFYIGPSPNLYSLHRVDIYPEAPGSGGDTLYIILEEDHHNRSWSEGFVGRGSAHGMQELMDYFQDCPRAQKRIVIELL
jgi:hypothetical protein